MAVVIDNSQMKYYILLPILLISFNF